MRRRFSKPLVIISISVLLLVTMISVTYVFAQDQGEEHNGGESDIASGLGGLAIGCLALASTYIVVRRLFMWSKSWGEENNEAKVIIKSLYGKYRKPLLYIHNVANITALIVSGIHGLLLLNAEGEHVITGIIAWSVMAFLTFFGALIYYKLRPIWENREVRGFLRFVHRQWILTGIMVIVLLIHMA